MITANGYYMNHYNYDCEFWAQVKLDIFAKKIDLSLVKLSALGARICYASEPPHILWESDPRITNKDDMFNFLNRCYKAKHFSVFAHTPIFGEIGNYNIRVPYKVFTFVNSIYNNLHFCATLRHVLEFASKFINAKDMPLDFYDGGNFLTPKYYSFEDKEWYNEPRQEYRYIMGFYLNKDPWKWYSFVFHGISRACANQIVRHTWLNFSQRSHRYTEVDGFVIPPSIEGKLKRKAFLNYYNEIKDKYNFIIEDLGINKEDARYITPVGSSTTLMASGPYFVWDDFIQKRNTPKAQKEIRILAEAIELFLS